MAKVADMFVSVVFVADANTKRAGEKTKQIATGLKARYANYEVLVIDNGLPHDEVASIRGLLPTVACIRVLRLSRNHDTDTAIFAGVESAIGDYICILYGNDPIELIPAFIDKAQTKDVVFGVARNLVRERLTERWGAKMFYWYSKRYLDIKIPNGATYYICMNRSVANALTRSGRFMRHIRHMAQQIGFSSTTLEYDLPEEALPYTYVPSAALISRAIDLVSNYSSHPLRAVSYFGIIAGLLNVVYAVYVVIINLSGTKVERGWTSLSLQSSLMFFLMFMIMAVLAEYIGKILNETQQEPPYHIMQELSSTISIADETRRNVTK